MHNSLKHSLLNPIRVVVATLLLAVLAMPAQAQANTPVTSNFNVTATVLTVCLVSSSALAFGNYDPTSSTATTGSTTVGATCTLGAPYTIALNNGNGTGASYSSGASGRKMTIQGGGSATLGYNLYQDSAFANVWGNVTGVLVSGTGTGVLQSYTVYGRIPAQQVASAGSYLDTITATLAF